MPYSTATDPVAIPPNGQVAWSFRTACCSSIIRDRNPAGLGDLIGLVHTATASPDQWYLLISTDDGLTWSYLTGTGTPPAENTATCWSMSVCQDTVNYRLHMAQTRYTDARAYYNRITLTYTNGHVTGWAWAAHDIQGPALSSYTHYPYYEVTKADIMEVVDGSSNHRLLITGIDHPSATRIKRLVASVTTIAAGIAPTTSGQWYKLDGSGAGLTVLGDWNTNTSTDSTSLVHFTNVDSREDSYDCDVATQQLSNGDLHFVIGMMYANLPDTAIGAVTRWRFTPSTTNWAIDAAAKGVTVAAQPAANQAKNCIGGACIKSDGSIGYFSYYTRAGLHVDTVDTAGTWTTDGVLQPDTTQPWSANHVWGWSALGYGVDGRLYVSYERNGGIPGNGADNCRQFEGYFDGAAWQLTETSTLWRRAAGYNPTTGGWDGSQSWSPVRYEGGAGTYAFPAADTDVYSVVYDAHVLTADLRLAAAATGGCAATSANLTTAIVLLGAAAGGCTATSANLMRLAGAAAGGCTATSGSVTTAIRLVGACVGGCTATSAGLITGIVLAGASVGGCAATSAGLTTDIRLTGATVGGGVGISGDVSTSILLEGAVVGGAVSTSADLLTFPAIALDGVAAVGVVTALGKLTSPIALAGSTIVGIIYATVYLKGAEVSNPYGTIITVGPLVLGATQVVTHGLRGTPTTVQPVARPTGIGVSGTPTATTVTFVNNGTATETADFLIQVDHSIQGVAGDNLYRGQGLSISSAGITFPGGGVQTVPYTGPAATGWKVALDVDFAAQPAQTLTTDSDYTIGGAVFTKSGTALEVAAMAVVPGSGLVIQPIAATQISSALFDVPRIEIPLLTVIPGLLWSMPFRIWAYMTGSFVDSYQTNVAGIHNGVPPNKTIFGAQTQYYAQQLLIPVVVINGALESLVYADHVTWDLHLLEMSSGLGLQAPHTYGAPWASTFTDVEVASLGRSGPRGASSDVDVKYMGKLAEWKVFVGSFRQNAVTAFAGIIKRIRVEYL